MQSLGIQSINIVTRYRNPQELSSIMINPPGYIQENDELNKKNIDMLGLPPNQSLVPNMKAKYLSVDLVHQIDQFLKIGDENCNPDATYNRDDCVNEQLRKV